MIPAASGEPGLRTLQPRLVGEERNIVNNVCVIITFLVVRSTHVVSRRLCLDIDMDIDMDTREEECAHCPGADMMTETLELGQCPSVNRVWTHKPRMYAHSTSAHHYTTARPAYVHKPVSYVQESTKQSYKLPEPKRYEPKTYGKRRRWRF